MPVELVIPSVGESITEVEIGDWLKKPGEPVNQDDPVVVLETEKVTVELPAPTSGTITTMLKQTGEKASVGDVVGYMEPNGAASTVTAVYERPVSKRSGADKPALQETSVLPQQPPSVHTGREEQVIPMTPIRRRIAERLVEAQKSAALLTTFNQVDMSSVLGLRREHQEAFKAKYQIKLGLMSFFVKAAIDALKAIPQLNAEVRGHDVVYRNYY